MIKTHCNTPVFLEWQTSKVFQVKCPVCKKRFKQRKRLKKEKKENA